MEKLAFLPLFPSLNRKKTKKRTVIKSRTAHAACHTSSFTGVLWCRSWGWRHSLHLYGYWYSKEEGWGGYSKGWRSSFCSSKGQRISKQGEKCPDVGLSLASLFFSPPRTKYAKEDLPPLCSQLLQSLFSWDNFFPLAVPSAFAPQHIPSPSWDNLAFPPAQRHILVMLPSPAAMQRPVVPHSAASWHNCSSCVASLQKWASGAQATYVHSSLYISAYLFLKCNGYFQAQSLLCESKPTSQLNNRFEEYLGREPSFPFHSMPARCWNHTEGCGIFKSFQVCFLEMPVLHRTLWSCHKHIPRFS